MKRIIIISFGLSLITSIIFGELSKDTKYFMTNLYTKCYHKEIDMQTYKEYAKWEYRSRGTTISKMSSFSLKNSIKSGVLTFGISILVLTLLNNPKINS